MKEAKRLKLDLPGSGENANDRDEEDLPPMWEKVPSESRPGEFSYRHKETLRKVRKRPTVNTPSRKPLSAAAAQVVAAVAEDKDEVQVSAKMDVTVLDEEDKDVTVLLEAKEEVKGIKTSAEENEKQENVSPQTVEVLKGEDSSQVITPPPKVIQPLVASETTTQQLEILSYGQRSFTRVINGGRRYPVGFHSKVLYSRSNNNKEVWYENHVLVDRFTVDCTEENMHFEAETCEAVWDKVYAAVGSSNGDSKSGFEMFGFANRKTQDEIRSMEEEWVDPVPFSAIQTVQSVPVMWHMRNEILRIVHENHPHEHDRTAAVKILENLVMFKTLTWANNVSSAAKGNGDGEQVQVFFPAKMIHLYAAIDVVSFCGLLSPEKALAVVSARVREKNPCIPYTYRNVVWNNVVDVQLVSTPIVNMTTPYFPCRVLTTKLTLPYIRKSLLGKLTQHTLDLDCSWTMHRNSFQVSMQSSVNANTRVVLSESADKCHEALSMALVNPLLVRELVSVAPALPSVHRKRCKWVLDSEHGEFIEFAKQDNKVYVKSVSFLLKNAIEAPRLGDWVIMVNDGSACFLREVDDVMACNQVCAVVFTRVNTVGMREQPTRPTTLFPSVVKTVAEDPVVGNILFGFTLSMIWYLEAHGKLPVLQDDTNTKRFTLNTPYYSFNYRQSVYNLRKALKSDLTSNIMVCDEPAAQDMEYTKAEEHCKMMALLDKESAALEEGEEETVVVEEEKPLSRAKLFPYVSCDALYKAGGKDVVVLQGDTGVILSGYQCKMLSGLPQTLAALNGMYVLREEEKQDDEQEADKLERWVFVGGEHELSRAFAGMMAMSRFPVSNNSSSKSVVIEHYWTLARFPLNVDESILLFRTHDGEWFVPQDGKWTKSNQVKFVSMQV